MVQFPEAMMFRFLLVATALGACALPPATGEPLDTAHFSQTGGGTSAAASGDLELEAEVDIDPSESLSTAVGVVFGLPDRLEVGIAWSPYDVLEQPGPDSRGSGDVSVAIKKQVLEPSSSQPGWSIELGTQLDTSEAGHLERSGEADLYAATALAQSFGAHTWTGYYELVFPDDPDDDSTHVEHVAALQWATELGAGQVVHLEGIGTVAPAADFSATYLGAGLAWAVNEDWTLEVGTLVGLAGESEDFRLLLGFTTVAARLGRIGSFGL